MHTGLTEIRWRLGDSTACFTGGSRRASRASIYQAAEGMPRHIPLLTRGRHRLLLQHRHHVDVPIPSLPRRVIQPPAASIYPAGLAYCSHTYYQACGLLAPLPSRLSTVAELMKCLVSVSPDDPLSATRGVQVRNTTRWTCRNQLPGMYRQVETKRKLKCHSLPCYAGKTFLSLYTSKMYTGTRHRLDSRGGDLRLILHLEIFRSSTLLLDHGTDTRSKRPRILCPVVTAGARIQEHRKIDA